MSFRSTVILGGVALLLGAWVWLVEVRGERSRVEREADARQVLALEADDVTRLRVPLEGGGDARLRRDADDPERWSLESPVAYPADPGVVSGILSALAELESKDTIEDPPEDLTPFGLGDEAPTLELEAEGQDPVRVRLGGDAPVGGLVYLRVVGEPAVRTVEKWRVSSLKPRLTGLRDKRVIGTEPDAVTGLAILEKGTLLVRLAKRESDWSLTEPIQDLADGRRVGRLLDDLHFMRATGFVDAPSELGDYGLDRPEIVLELVSEEGLERLALGRGGEKVYASSGREGVLYEVADRVLADVPRDLFSYRDKRVLEVDGDRAARIELRFPRSDVTYGFAREGNEWKTEQEGVRMDSLRVEDVLYAVRDLEARGLEERSIAPSELGLDPPGVRVTVFDGEGTELGWVELGDPEPDAGLAARSSRTDRVWRVENEIGKDVPLTLEAFRTNFLDESAEEGPGTPPAGEPAGS